MSQKREAITQEQPQPEQPTMEQIGQQLNDWLAKNEVTLQIVALGRTGTPIPIDDFLPPTHQASVTLVKAQK